ncbi:MAG: DNA primase [Gammaproteobacteria bacterium]|nr:DNA primase [Gammaproteobacteria bacterium]MCY4219858.1 DNA primase [Gammaproteobacteria bacterium]MCY4275153.1 DNA primase [Gammaproteobacteria bacterium]
MARHIPREFIDELMQRTDIVDVIESMVPLQKKGREYMACCPFHDEKTPSFTVSPQKQFFYCFGCGESGSAIDFLMKYQNLGFVEAIEDLANRAGLEIPRSNRSDNFKRLQGQTDELLEVLNQANLWFQEQLKSSPDRRIAVGYLQSRGLNAKMINEFGVGFAPEGWNGLTKGLGKTPSQLEKLMKAGLINNKSNEQGRNRYFDRFRGRIMFPIEDSRGRIVGFGGRDLTDKGPKYLNSPETPLFHKGRELYGLHRARRAIGKQKRSLVVEGYMDVVSLVQFGIENVVAALGTATTPHQLQHLFRLASDIVFCFDGDQAGKKAAWKALKTALPELSDGRQVSFLFLKEGEDPDTTVRSTGAESFLREVDSAIPLTNFLFESLMAEIDLDRMEGRAKLASLAKPLLMDIPGITLRSIMFDRLSTLCGTTVKPDESNQSSRPRIPTTDAKRRSGRHIDGQLPLVAQAVSLLLQDPSLANKGPNFSALDELQEDGLDVLVGMLDTCCRNPDVTTARLLERFRDAPYHSYLEYLAFRDHQVPENLLVEHFEEIILKLLARLRKQRHDDLIAKSEQRPLNQREKEELLSLQQERIRHTAQLEE